MRIVLYKYFFMCKSFILIPVGNLLQAQLTNRLLNMKFKTLYLFYVLCLLFLQTQAQESPIAQESTIKKCNALVPRFGIGVSRHFITEAGFGIAHSKFVNDKQLGLNTTIQTIYLSYETMTPYKKPLVHGYKIGGEFIFIGHVTSAAGIEVAYYTKAEKSSMAIIPKIGIPLVNGSLSYGLGIYFNADMRKEIGRHRVSLTYSINKKSNKILDKFLKERSVTN